VSYPASDEYEYGDDGKAGKNRNEDDSPQNSQERWLPAGSGSCFFDMLGEPATCHFRWP
jgi:hypothetical protein